MGIFGPDVDKTVKKLVDKIRNAYSFDEQKAKEWANTLVQLIPSFKDGDKEYTLKKMTEILDDYSEWKREIASYIVVQVKKKY